MKVLACRIMQTETWEDKLATIPNIQVETNLCWWLRCGRTWAIADRKGNVHAWHGDCPIPLGVRPLVYIKSENHFKPGERIIIGGLQYTVVSVSPKYGEAVAIPDRVFTNIEGLLDDLQKQVESKAFAERVENGEFSVI